MTTASIAPNRARTSDAPTASGLRRAAILVAQLNKDEAAAVLGHLSQREIESLTAAVVSLDLVEIGDVDGVLRAACNQLRSGRRMTKGGPELAREILEAGLGTERADEILSGLNAIYRDVPFGSLRGVDVRQLITFLRDEHPQVIALVLAHLPAGQSAEVLTVLSREQQADVAHRIATMGRPAPDMVGLVEKQLHERLRSVLAQRSTSKIGGVESLVEIMNRSARPTERSILEWLDTADPTLAEEVRTKLFVFEDITVIDDRTMQRVLRQVEMADLTLALKGVRPDVQEKVFRNISEQAATNLSEELELLGPVRTSQVEQAQAKVVGVIRKMEENGELTIVRGDDEMIS